jgi:hypothetical protein
MSDVDHAAGPTLDDQDLAEAEVVDVSEPELEGLPEPDQMVRGVDEDIGLPDVNQEEVGRAVDPGPESMPADEAALRVEIEL